MIITHNEINRYITELGAVVSKGSLGAKHNKHRRIRQILRDMVETQSQRPTFREIWGYFLIFIRYNKTV